MGHDHAKRLPVSLPQLEQGLKRRKAQAASVLNSRRQLIELFATKAGNGRCSMVSRPLSVSPLIPPALWRLLPISRNIVNSLYIIAILEQSRKVVPVVKQDLV